MLWDLQETSLMKFKLRSSYQPRGDQPAAIEQLVRAVEGGARAVPSTEN